MECDFEAEAGGVYCDAIAAPEADSSAGNDRSVPDLHDLQATPECPEPSLLYNNSQENAEENGHDLPYAPVLLAGEEDEENMSFEQLKAAAVLADAGSDTFSAESADVKSAVSADSKSATSAEKEEFGGENGTETDTGTAEIPPVPEGEESADSATAVVGDEGAVVAPSNEDPPATATTTAANKTRTSTSIYYNNNIIEAENEKPAKPKPTKRVTMAERAAKEALASFGGTDFGSITVRKVDLRKTLKEEAEKKREEEKGEREKEGEEEGGRTELGRKRPRTRLQIAREEANARFGRAGLGEGAKKKYPKVMMAKLKAKECAAAAVAVAKHKSKVQQSQENAFDQFDGASLDELPVKKKAKLEPPSSHQYSLTHANEKRSSGHQKQQQQQHQRLTRAEKARMEALKSFGGSTLDNILGEAKRKVARNVELGNPAKKSDKDGDGNDTDVICDDSDAGDGEAMEGVVSGGRGGDEAVGDLKEVKSSVADDVMVEKENVVGSE